MQKRFTLAWLAFFSLCLFLNACAFSSASQTKERAKPEPLIPLSALEKGVTYGEPKPIGTITDRQLEYAQKVAAQLDEAGIRVHLDDRKEKVNLKIREAQLQKVPFMLVVGDREATEGTVAVRNRKHGDQGAKPVAQFISDIQTLVENKTVTE